MNKCVRTTTIRYEIKPSAGNGPLERQFCPSTEFAGEPMTHAQNDARYIAQGMTLFLSPNPDSAKDLARMNEGKNGRPFIYDEETMMVMAGIVYQLRLAGSGKFW